MKSVLLSAMLVVLLTQPAHAAPPDDISIYAVSLVGSPYRLGGTSPETGLDCSGFVDHVFRQIIGIKLPHENLANSESTQALDRTDLQPCDLVNNNTHKHTKTHDGIYLGDGRFVHATS